MTWRVVLAELKQETATFNPAPTVYDDFEITPPSQLLETFRPTQTEMAGVLEVLEADSRIEVVPAMAAAAVSGGYVQTVDLNRLIAELLESIRAAGPVGGALVCLHGAMAGKEEGDPEGRLLQEVRSLIGAVPLVASLDLHAVLTDRMIANSDLLVPYHTYPHADHHQTGVRAARLLVRLLDGRVKPTIARVALPMLVRGDELLTATGRFGEAIAQCQQIEQSDAGLAAGVLIGNAFTDVPDLQSNVLVTTDNDPDLAQREARQIADFMWNHRRIFQADLTPLDQAIDQAQATDGLVVFSDAADATASGASGDSNVILRELLAARFAKRGLLAVVDEPAVNVACDAGVGSQVTVLLGGTRDRERFEPLAVPARVKSLHDGRFTYEDGTAANAGRAAVLVLDDRISVLVTARPVYVVGRRVFQCHGLEPTDFDLVVVKSPNGFRTWYESLAALIVAVDAPGSTSANLKSLPFQHCVRPMFPLDEI